MIDASNTAEGSNVNRPGEGGEVIDAAARTRPRIHSAKEARPKEIEELAFLGDVPLKLNMVLGDARLPLGEVIALETDSIVQLNKPSGDPVDIYVENQKLGTGEVIVIHERLRIRVLEITSPLREQEELEAKEPKEEQEE